MIRDSTDEHHTSETKDTSICPWANIRVHLHGLCPKVLVVAILTVALSSITCYVQATSRYIRNENNSGIIVFVHGLFGDATTSWTNSTTNSYWPKLLTQDSIFDTMDVYVYEYPSPKLRSSYSINELAENMRLVLMAERLFQLPSDRLLLRTQLQSQVGKRAALQAAALRKPGTALKFVMPIQELFNSLERRRVGLQEFSHLLVIASPEMVDGVNR